MENIERSEERNLPVTFFQPIIGDRVYLADLQAVQRENNSQRHFFTDEGEFAYVPFCDDFGPLNLSCTLRFVSFLESKLSEYVDNSIIYCVEPNPRQLTNAAFLLGAYMILKVGINSNDVWSCFSPMASLFTSYRDATFTEADFGMNLIDCWRGLVKAKRLGWITLYDLEEYDHYDNPLEGDLHVVVPDKLIAFRGPRTIHGEMNYHDTDGCRHFSPRFYIEPFSDMNVNTVVRLNEPNYDDSEFQLCGLSCVGLEFEDCTAPPTDIVDRFLRTVRSASGTVAVHCKAGLGRTGTLIAIYIMCDYGFSAREAIAWLRIVRPGSVIGEQQHFLCAMDHFRSPAIVMPIDTSVSETECNGESSLEQLSSSSALRHNLEVCRSNAEQVASALHSSQRIQLKARQAIAIARNQGRDIAASAVQHAIPGGGVDDR